jgi:hypothetical protein
VNFWTLYAAHNYCTILIFQMYLGPK